MKIIESLKGVKIEDLGIVDWYNSKQDTRQEFTWYVKDQNVALHFYSSGLYVVNLVTALKRGAFVDQYIVTYEDLRDASLYNHIAYIMKCCYKDLNEFVKEVMNFEIASVCEVQIIEKRGIDVFTPFKEQKKIEIPKKWGVQHIIKGILSGQIKEGQCIQILTDDYSRDAENNFYKGKLDLMEFCKDLVEHTSGWRCNVDKINEDGTISLDVNMYSFNRNRLIFDYNGGIRDFKIEDVTLLNEITKSNVIYLNSFR